MAEIVDGRGRMGAGRKARASGQNRSHDE